MIAIVRPGLRDELITEATRDIIAELGDRAKTSPLDTSDSAYRLGRHLGAAVQRVLLSVDESAQPDEQVAIVNAILKGLSPEDRVALPPQLLLGILESTNGSGLVQSKLPDRPEIPLSMSDLLFGGEGQPSIGSELRAELQSAAKVDLICAFVIWSGLRVLRDEIADMIERGGQLRVITTAYMGVTDPRALNLFCELGAEVRVAFDARITKLHAKSWLIEREAGLSTAFVGSSNLSHTALLDGLEWNVRLSQTDAPQMIERIRTAFATIWANEHFEPYTPDREEELRIALGENSSRRSGDRSVSFVGLDVNAYPHQQKILEQLTIERERHDRHRNLVVAATGTGKTVVAALDYRNLREKAGKDLSLLFIAHRREILEQARDAYRAVTHDQSFGEILGAGEVPTRGRHVFAMIQSLDKDKLTSFEPDAFDVVVVDEFHHAAAKSYVRALEHVNPAELLGMTATPIRMDGQDVTKWFDGRIAYELKLWEAIDQGFLSPFQYFGVADGTDLSSLEWRSGGYVTQELENVFTGDHQRVGKLVKAIEQIVEDPLRMKALGFCVSVAHAEFMAQQFTKAGLKSVAISGETNADVRSQALRDLGSGELRAIFSVDVFGEGVDVPDVDTVFLLRPTQSATVLTQQIGRGLRRAEGKRCLTVIDMIGQHHRKFRFADRIAALIDPKHGSPRTQVEDGFPYLPAGCDITFDRVAYEIALENLRAAEKVSRWQILAHDLRALGDVSLSQYLDTTDFDVHELYRRPGKGWTDLRRAALLPTPEPVGKDEEKLLRAVGRLLHIDDKERCDFYSHILSAKSPPRLANFDPRQKRLLAMLHFDLWGLGRKFSSFDEGFETLWPHESVRSELLELFALLDAESRSVTRPSELSPEIALMTHATYSRDEIVAALGLGTADKPPQVREGVRWVPESRVDALFVNLHKTERDYSPTTMYNDYAISPTLFHWESQSTTSADSPTGQRYIHHERDGSHIALFARARKKTPQGKVAPYRFLGTAAYVSHEGERPMAITWQLRQAIPESLFEEARAIAAA